MANTVSITIRAQNRTRSAFNGVDRSLRRTQARLLRASRNSTHFSGALRTTARGLGVLRTGLQAAGRGTGALISGFGALTGAAGKSKGGIALVAVGLALLGPAASALAAILTVGLGAAFIGLGAMALKGDKQVKAAFSGMKDNVVSTVKEAAAPMKPYLIDGMNLVASEARKMKPALTQAFSSAGPLIRPLTEGLLGLAKGAMPGFNASLSRSGPIMQGFKEALGDIGTGVGDFFDTITAGSNSQALGDTWRQMGAGINSLLDSLGGLMDTLIGSKTATLAMAATFGQLKLVIEGVNAMFKGLEAGLGLVDKVTGGFVSKVADEVTPTTKKWKSALSEAGEAAKENSRSLKSLMSAMEALNEKARGSLDAQAGFEQAIDDVAEAAKKNANSLRMSGGELDLNSQKSRDAYGALSGLAGATKEAATAAGKNGAAWSKVNGIYTRGRKKLVDAAMQMGLTRVEAQKLAGQILRTPNKTAQLKGNLKDLAKKVKQAKEKIKSVPQWKLSSMRGTLSDLSRKVADAKRKLRSVPKSKRSSLRATIADLEQKIRTAKARIASVRGKTVTITTVLSTIGGGIAGMYASGGVVGAQHAAEGGPRGGRVLVGEQGPEIVRLPGGSSVTPHGQTRRILEGSRGGGGGRTVIELRSDGSRLAELLLEVLRKSIRDRGGDVQVVLGQGR
ncbi:hypothetical protein LHJ74_14765 [Streptomyces sp. N2-109]|uniref:Uncharacterized protein n=1 Tax=Streptomyces gossypii TaxID=2883101 RepID=A0ABT2JUK6_9ACTN|nr:hypothetical protein [Streptomyces gossypii]MCT2591154.1 hypothetical protein [Streptomyces gossypii]